MKMHQMAFKIGVIVRGVFTDTITFEGYINGPKCYKAEQAVVCSRSTSVALWEGVPQNVLCERCRHDVSISEPKMSTNL